MRRFAAAALTGATTLVTTAWTLASQDPALEMLLVVAVGAPLTVFLLVAALADPSGSGRPWSPSLLLGATVVPALVLLLGGGVFVAGYLLVEPLVETTSELWEQLRGDPELLRTLTSGWALVLIVQLAIVAPLAEESLKPLGAVVRRPRSGSDAFLLGAAAGTGFAMVENVLYSSGWFFGSVDGWLPVAVARMLGAGLHAFGAGLVAWGWFQLRQRRPGRWRRFWLSYWIALTVHGLWNGSIAVAIVLAAARETGGLRARGDAYAWGVVLMILLAVLGVMVTAALLLMASRIGQGQSPLRVVPLQHARTPQGVAAWSLASATMLIPLAILVLVYPDIVAL